jgi:hypothetical protein
MGFTMQFIRFVNLSHNAHDSVRDKWSLTTLECYIDAHVDLSYNQLKPFKLSFPVLTYGGTRTVIGLQQLYRRWNYVAKTLQLESNQFKPSIPGYTIFFTRSQTFGDSIIPTIRLTSDPICPESRIFFNSCTINRSMLSVSYGSGWNTCHSIKSVALFVSMVQSDARDVLATSFPRGPHQSRTLMKTRGM